MDLNHWDIDDFDSSDLVRCPRVIHIYAHTNEQNEGDKAAPPTNHWSSFLELDNNRSVGLDMIPGFGSDGQRGKIVLVSNDHPVTHSAMKTLSFPVHGTATVQTFVDLIQRNGREKYTFTTDWEGCRYWIHTVITDWAGTGLLGPNSGQETWDAVSYYWRFPNGSELREVGQGVFR